MKLLRPPQRGQLLKWLTTARQRAGLTPAELADKVTASSGFTRKYEDGERGPSATRPTPSSPVATAER